MSKPCPQCGGAGTMPENRFVLYEFLAHNICEIAGFMNQKQEEGAFENKRVITLLKAREDTYILVTEITDSKGG